MHVQGQIEFTIVEQHADKVVSRMPMSEGIRNPFGIAHAGALIWFADVTAMVLANDRLVADITTSHVLSK